MPELLARSDVHVGAVRGRYFRENFAQGGIDLVQIVPELVTNADAAIAAAGRERGRIELRAVRVPGSRLPGCVAGSDARVAGACADRLAIRGPLQ